MSRHRVAADSGFRGGLDGRAEAGPKVGSTQLPRCGACQTGGVGTQRLYGESSTDFWLAEAFASQTAQQRNSKPTYKAPRYLKEHKRYQLMHEIAVVRSDSLGDPKIKGVQSTAREWFQVQPRCILTCNERWNRSQVHLSTSAPMV